MSAVGATIGVVVIVVAGAALVLGGAFWCWMCRGKELKLPPPESACAGAQAATSQETKDVESGGQVNEEKSRGDPNRYWLGQLYFIDGSDATMSTSGKCVLRSGGSSVPSAPHYTFKLSSDPVGLMREWDAFARVLRNEAAKKHISEVVDIILVSNAPRALLVAPVRSSDESVAALVLEKGVGDMRSMILGDKPKWLAFTGNDSKVIKVPKIRVIVVQVAEAIKAIHDAGLVWRGVDPQNLLLYRPSWTCDQVWKAADLETVCEIGAALDDNCSPPYAPPELATARMNRAAHTVMAHPSFDAWGLGMLLLELLQGEHYLAAEIAQAQAQGRTDWSPVWSRLSSSDFTPCLHDHIDRFYASTLPDEARLLKALLCRDPADRLSIPALLRRSNFSGSISTSVRKDRAELQALKDELAKALTAGNVGRADERSAVLLAQESSLVSAVQTAVAAEGGQQAGVWDHALRDMMSGFAGLKRNASNDEESLMKIRESLYRIETQMVEMGETVKTAAQGQTEMLRTLIKGEYRCPRFIIFTPKPKGGEPATRAFLKQVVRPSTWGRVKWKLQIVCPVCCERVPCGPKGNGYTVMNPTQTLKVLAPALRITLKLITVAGGLTLGMGIPVPIHVPTMDVISTLDELAMGLMAVASTSVITEYHERGAKSDAGELTAAVKMPPREEEDVQVTKVTEEAWRALYAFLKDSDPHLQHLGVVKVTHAASGKTEWVCAMCEKGFERAGVRYTPPGKKRLRGGGSWATR